MQMLYLCNIQTITTANIKQIFVLQNILTQNFRDMEEKKMNEAQVAEQTTSQVESELDVIINENKALKEANEQLQKKYESEKKSCLRYYRQMNMLKQAIEKLTKDKKISEDDVVKAVLVGQNLMSLEDLLFTLAD